MKISNTVLLIFAATALARVTIQPRADSVSVLQDNPLAEILEKRRGCTGNRVQGDVCTGKLLRARNSFHNCKDSSRGWCCAKNKSGDYGLDVNKGQSREDCGYCFSGKCRAE